MAPRWTPDDDAQLRAWYAKYVPLAEIGRRLGRTAGGVHARRIALDLPARRRRWPWPESIDQHLVAAARAGEPVVRVARRFGLSPDAVSRHRRHAGLGAGARRRWTPDEDAVLRDGVAAGDAPHQLARRLDRTAVAVADRMHRIKPSAAPSSSPPRWTDREDDLLRSGYAACLTCEAIAEQLIPERSARAVSARAHRLALTTYGRRWTAAEDLALRHLAQRGATASTIARSLTRTTQAVRRRADRLGIPLARPPRQRRTPWTEHEDALLHQWRRLEPGQLAQLLGRSDRSVVARLRALDLRPAGSPHYQAPASARLTPAQQRLLERYSSPLTKRRVLALAARFDREPLEVLRLVEAHRKRRAA